MQVISPCSLRVLFAPSPQEHAQSMPSANVMYMANPLVVAQDGAYDLARRLRADFPTATTIVYGGKLYYSEWTVIPLPASATSAIFLIKIIVAQIRVCMLPLAGGKVKVDYPWGGVEAVRLNLSVREDDIKNAAIETVDRIAPGGCPVQRLVCIHCVHAYSAITQTHGVQCYAAGTL